MYNVSIEVFGKAAADMKKLLSIKRSMVALIVIVLTLSFGTCSAYAAAGEPTKIQLNVTTNPFVDYGDDPSLFKSLLNHGVIDPSVTKGICSVHIDIEGHAKNVRIDAKATDITIAGNYDGPNHAEFEIGTLDGSDSRSLQMIDADCEGNPHLEISVTADGLERTTWSCDFDMETKARAILLVDPAGGDDDDDKSFENDLKMMEEVFQNCWYNGKPVEIISIWAPEEDVAMTFSDLPSQYLEEDALGQLTSMGIDGNDLTYVYLNAHGLNSEQFVIPNDTGGIIGDISYATLIDWLDENVPGQIVVIADSCYSGGLIEEASTQSDALPVEYSPGIYDRFVILTAVSPDSTASMWSSDVDLDFERWPGGYAWFTHDIYRAALDTNLSYNLLYSYGIDYCYYNAKENVGILSVELFYEILDALSDEGLKVFNKTIDPQVYGVQFKPLFVVKKDASIAVAPCPVNIQQDGVDDLETMLIRYYWYGGIQSPQIYVFSSQGTFECQGIVPGRSDLSYDSNMIISTDDFVETGPTGTWEVSDNALILYYYDSGGEETYHFYSSDDNGPEDNWPAYFYGEWDAIGVLGNAYTEHQTLGRINRK